MVQSLHIVIGEKFGAAARDLLYRIGYDWSLRDMVRLNQNLHDELGSGTDLWQMDAKFILDSWWIPQADAGWGRVTFDLSAISRGTLFIELKNSAFAAAFDGSDQPVCHLYAGLFAGALSFFERSERHAAEMQCVAAGASACRFVVGPAADIDAAENWRQQGVEPAELVRRLSS